MVVRVVVFLAVLATFLAGGRSAWSADEPLAPCHTRVSTIDGQGHRFVTYTDESGDVLLADTISEVVAAFNADLAKVRLVAALDGDITINEGTSGSVGRTTLTCFGQTGSAAIVINTAALDLRSPSSAVSKDLVVMHEFGHALGLAHTTQACALMHPNDSDCARPELIRFTEGERRTVDALYGPDRESAQAPRGQLSRSASTIFVRCSTAETSSVTNWCCPEATWSGDAAALVRAARAEPDCQFSRLHFSEQNSRGRPIGLRRNTLAQPLRAQRPSTAP